MIKLKIVECKDKSYLGEITFYKNIIYLGRELTCDLYIPDEKINKNHLFIEIADTKLIVQAGTETEFFWVNGKKTKKFKYLNVGDKIELKTQSHNFTIVIEGYHISVFETKKDALNNISKKIETDYKDHLELIASLKEKL